MSNPETQPASWAKPPFEVRWNTEIEKKQMEWLWPGFIPRGLLTMITGEPSAGKSTFLCELAAAVATGRPLPNDEGPPRDPARVWIMTSEDPADMVVMWRLENQGLSPLVPQVAITDKKAPINAASLPWMREFISSNGIALVVIDTLTTWLGGDVDMNAANEAMEWMNGLAQLAKETNCAIVTVRHKRKAQDTGPKIHHGMGSIGFTGAVRSELVISKGNNGIRTVERIKGNYKDDPPILLYTIEEHPDPENQHGVLVWKGTMAVTDQSGKRQLMGRRPTMRSFAKDWLVKELKDGPKPMRVLLKEAAEMRITEASLRRAKADLGIEAFRKDEAWYWGQRIVPAPESA